MKTDFYPRFREYAQQIGLDYEKGSWRIAGRKTTREKLQMKILTDWGDVSPKDIAELLDQEELRYAQSLPSPEDEKTLRDLYNKIMSALFQWFTWAVDPNGRVKVFSRTRADAYQVREIVAQPTELHRELRDAVMVVFAQFPDSLDKLREDMHTCHSGMKLEHGTAIEAWIKAGLNPMLLENPDARMSEPPIPVSDDPAVPCLLYVDRSLIVQGGHPAWDQIEGKLHPDEAKVFKAYLWSIFDPVNHGRQGLWIKGGRATGKSVAISAISKVMGEACAAVSANSMGNQFWAAKIHRRRLAVYADCKYARFLTDGKFHSVLGGDPVDVEHKHKGSETHRVHCRVIVGANIAPEVNLEADDEASRVILIELDNDRVDTSKFIAKGGFLLGDGSFEEALVEEFWHYLYDCEGAYSELCPTRQNIILPDYVVDKIHNQCGSPEDALFATIAVECLSFTTDADPIDASVFRQWLTKQSGSLGRDNQAVGRFYQYLERHHRVKRSRLSESSSRITHLLGVRIVSDLPVVRAKRRVVG